MEFKAIYELLSTHLKCFNIRDNISKKITLGID